MKIPLDKFESKHERAGILNDLINEIVGSGDPTEAETLEKALGVLRPIL